MLVFGFKIVLKSIKEPVLKNIVPDGSYHKWEYNIKYISFTNLMQKVKITEFPEAPKAFQEL